MTSHDADREFLAWLRSPATTRGALALARNQAMQEWRFVALTRELNRREGLLKCFAPM